MSTSRDEPAADRRRERSRRTRRRVAEAAYSLFCARGYNVALTEIAQKAGISVQNLYVLFGNKHRLVEAALQLAVLGDDLPLGPHERPWFDQVVKARGPREAIGAWVANTLPIYGRVAPLAGMFLSEPSLTPMWEHSEQLRLEGFRYAMEIVASKGTLRAGLDVARATDVMFVVLGPLAYQEFIGARGWSPHGWGDWTADALTRLLFED